MQSIEDIVEPYIELEQNVRKRMISLFSETCGMCTACCCRADICEEAVQSAFLSRLLERQDRKSDDMDDRYGWLDLHGCSLEYGRPPVCYVYFCDELLARLPDEEARWIMRILGRLVEYVGEDASGNRHLVEISESPDLEALDVAEIAERLSLAQEALEAIDGYFESGYLETAERKLLDQIGIPES